MPTPLVTVLMPVHNGAAYLRASVDSILRQSFADFEFLIVDDCSTDDSPAIVQSYADPRIRLVRAHERLRICHALNLGLEQAAGQFIARMDADDISHPRRLEKQVAYMTLHSDVALCGTWVRRFGTADPAYVDTRPADFESIRAYALFNNPMFHSTVMLRHETLEKHQLRYAEEFRNAEDYDLWTRLFGFGRAANLPAALLDYRVHPGSVTVGASAAMDEAACRVVQRLLSPLRGELAPEMVLFHRHMGTQRLYPAPTMDSFLRAERWLERLLRLNAEKHVYSDAAFRAVLGDIWFQLCYHSLNLGWEVVQCFLGADVCSSTPRQKSVMVLAGVKRRLRAGTKS